MHILKLVEATHNAQQQSYGKTSQYWGDSKDDVECRFCSELASMSGNYLSTSYMLVLGCIQTLFVIFRANQLD